MLKIAYVRQGAQLSILGIQLSIRNFNLPKTSMGLSIGVLVTRELAVIGVLGIMSVFGFDWYFPPPLGLLQLRMLVDLDDARCYKPQLMQALFDAQHRIYTPLHNLQT